MKKYTYEEWLKGLDKIEAKKENFNLIEWVKVDSKRIELCESAVDEAYLDLIEDYEKAIDHTISEDTFKQSLFEELSYTLENLHMQKLDLSPELQELVPFFQGLRRVQDLKHSILSPEIPNIDDYRKAIKALAYVRFYQYLQSDSNEKTDRSKPSEQGLSTTQRLLIVYYLNKGEGLSLTKIHMEATKQAIVLSKLFGRNYDNVYRSLNMIINEKNKPKYFNLSNLKAILPIFQELENKSIIEEINEEIRLIEINSGKD